MFPPAAGHVLRKGHAPFEQGLRVTLPPAWAGLVCDPSPANRGREAGRRPLPCPGHLPAPGVPLLRNRAVSLFLEKACSDLGVVLFTSDSHASEKP